MKEKGYGTEPLRDSGAMNAMVAPLFKPIELRALRRAEMQTDGVAAEIDGGKPMLSMMRAVKASSTPGATTRRELSNNGRSDG